MAFAGPSSGALPVRTAPPSANKANATNTTGLDSPVFASWDRAIIIFKEELTNDKAKIGALESVPKADFSDIREAAATACANVAAKRFKYTPAIQKVFQQINQYAAVGDIFMQQSEYTAFAWGAFRFLIMAGAEEGTTSTNLSKDLDEVLQIMFRTQFYADQFSSCSAMANLDIFQSLQDNITRLYSQVLNFLIRAYFFFEKSSFKRHFHAARSPYSASFQGIINQIEKLQQNVERDVLALQRQADSRRDNYAWLRPADYSVDFEKLNKAYMDHTCEWFFKNDKFTAWDDTSSSDNLLWVQGKPGCGKSTIAARVVKSLESSSGQIATYIFCKIKEDGKNSLVSILCGLVSQILQNSTNQKLHSLIEACRSSQPSTQPSLSTLWNLLNQLFSEVEGIRCIVDGLDECIDNIGDREDFLSNLTELFESKQMRKSQHRLAIFSRLDPKILKSGNWISINIAPEDVSEDIEYFVATSLKNSPKLCQHPQKDRMQKYLTENSTGMILWAKLMLFELEIGFKNIDRVLSKVPKGLFEVYSTILKRLADCDSTEEEEQIQHLLNLVLIAVRPLTIAELSVALVVSPQSKLEEYQPEPYTLDETRDIIQMASPLLVILPDDTVQPTHTSLVQYLFSDQSPKTHQDAATEFNFEKNAMQVQMALTICAYLQSPDFERDPRYGCESGDFSYWHEYACKNLIRHSVKTIPCADIFQALREFYDSKFGWKWLMHLYAHYDTSYGDLQILQSQFRSYIEQLGTEDEKQKLNYLLVYLSKKACSELERSPNDGLAQLVYTSRLANFHHLEGQSSAAEILEVQVMEMRKKLQGPEHADTIQCIQNLAITYWNQGRWEEAEELQVQVLETRKKILGVEHLNTLKSMNNLASTYRKQGRWEEAEGLEIHVLEAVKRVLGVEHPDTLICMNNLAGTYCSQGRLDKAKKLQIEVLEARRRVLGAEYPNTLTSMNNLANTYRHQGRLEEAEELDIQVLKARKRVLGAEHPDTLNSMGNLASTYWSQGRLEEAEKLEIQTIAARKRGLGAEHPDTIASMNNLSHIIYQKGERLEAIKLLEQCVQLSGRVFGFEHHHTKASSKTLIYWQSQNSDVKTRVEDLGSE